MHLCAALCSSVSLRSNVTAPSVCVVLLRQYDVGAGELPSENVSSSNSFCQQMAMSRHGPVLAIMKPRMVAQVGKYRINGERDVPSLQCYVLMVTWYCPQISDGPTISQVSEISAYQPRGLWWIRLHRFVLVFTQCMTTWPAIAIIYHRTPSSWKVSHAAGAV